MITALIVAYTLSRPGLPLETPAPFIEFTVAPVTLRVNAKSGDVVRGTKAFRVVVDTDEVVNQVEFYVNGQLRKTDESSPYDFELNTLEEADGAIKVKFVAYTALSHKADKELSLTINNEVGLGAEAHVKKAKECLVGGDYDGALTEGRIALKAQKDYVPARVVLARAFLGKGILDEALNNAQEAVATDPKNAEALDVQAVIALQQAFSTFNSGGDRKETMTSIKNSMITAVNARRAVLDQMVDNAKLDPANPVPYADLAIKAGRYPAAISALLPVFRADNRKVDVGNRLAFAQMRALRMTDANTTIGLVMKYGQPDAYSYALLGVLAFEKGDTIASDEAIKQALLNDISNIGLKTAQAYIALRRNKPATLQPIARELSKEEGQRSEVDYFLSSLYYRVKDYSNSRKFFERALLAEPTNVDMYVEQANQAIMISTDSKLAPQGSDPKKESELQLEVAHNYLEVARLARPESPQALTGLAIVAMLQNNPADAVKYGEAAMAAGPEYTPGLYTYAGAMQKEIARLQSRATENRRLADGAGADKGRELRAQASDWEHQASDMIRASQNLLIKAGKLDPTDLGGREAPDGPAAFRYYSRHGQTPVMSAP